MRLGTILFVALALTYGQNAALADPVDISFIQPVTKQDGSHRPARISTQAFSGWPLTIGMTMNDELGIASSNGDDPPFFPARGSTGFVLFDDPDGCLILDWNLGLSNWNIPTGPTCYDDAGNQLITVSDELYFEFTPDLDDVGVTDYSGNFARRAELIEALSGRPEIDPVGGGPLRVGPITSVILNSGTPEEEEIIDGYGYGADDDVPGLVLLARHGPGIVYQANGIAKSPLELRNLAGFTNAVSYELNNSNRKTTITAHMVLPPFLIAPVVIADESYDVMPDEINVGWRVDGAAEIVVASDYLSGPVADTFKTGYTKLVSQTKFKVSAMVVSGVAPNTVIDMNGDNIIDELDLKYMGYQVLGRKKSIWLLQFPAQPCFGGSGTNTVYADLDGNGSSELSFVCPAGPGSVSEPPR